MTQPIFNTYDLSPPRPPNLADFNGAQKQDDGNKPPDPTTMPNAAEDNTIKQTVVAMGNILPLVEVSVTASGTPSISGVLSPTSAVHGTPSAFFLTRTAGGNYHVEIGNSVPTAGFPAFTGTPKAWVNDLGPTAPTIQCVYETGPNGNPSIHVQTKDGGSLSDMNFVVQFR